MKVDLFTCSTCLNCLTHIPLIYVLESKNKNDVYIYPHKPQFCYIKVGFEGSVKLVT